MHNQTETRSTQTDPLGSKPESTNSKADAVLLRLQPGSARLEPVILMLVVLMLVITTIGLMLGC